MPPVHAAPPDPELVDERHAWLLERVEADRRVTTTDAATELGVSVDTVRRDLRLLPDDADVALNDPLVDGLVVVGARRGIAALVAVGGGIRRRRDRNSWKKNRES